MMICSLGRKIGHLLPRGIVTLVSCLMFCSLFSTAYARQEIVTLSSRCYSTGQGITVSYLLDAPDAEQVRLVLLTIPGGNGVIKLARQADGTVTHSGHHDLFSRLMPGLRGRSIVVAVPDVPADRSNGISLKFRRDRDHSEDLGKIVKDLRKRYPEARLFLAASGSGAVSALRAGQLIQPAVSGVILAGADSGQLYAHDQSVVKVPVLVLHHTEDGCAPCPFIEAQELAQRYSFTFVPFVGEGLAKDTDPCSADSVHGFVGLDDKVMDTIINWVEKRSINSALPEDAKMFLNERVLQIPMRNGSENITLQTTVFKPDGPGPFPLAILSHGVDTDQAMSGESRVRERYAAQCQVFVNWGFAVAIPMRRGYGQSGGMPNRPISYDAFGLEDTKEIQATIDFMSQQPYVDEKQMVLVGHSGGGLVSLAYGSLGKVNPKGIINFAGGLRSSGGPRASRWPLMIAEAFASYAKTTLVPSIWFYAANDSLFPPDVARMAYEAYQKENGQAKLFALPAFKKDGHGLFSDASGVEIWRGEVLKFLQQIGFAVRER